MILNKSLCPRQPVGTCLCSADTCICWKCIRIAKNASNQLHNFHNKSHDFVCSAFGKIAYLSSGKVNIHKMPILLVVFPTSPHICLPLCLPPCPQSHEAFRLKATSSYVFLKRCSSSSNSQETGYCNLSFKSIIQKYILLIFISLQNRLETYSSM